MAAPERCYRCGRDVGVDAVYKAGIEHERRLDAKGNVMCRGCVERIEAKHRKSRALGHDR